jgi:hypothetical protein
MAENGRLGGPLTHMSCAKYYNFYSLSSGLVMFVSSRSRLKLNSRISILNDFVRLLDARNVYFFHIISLIMPSNFRLVINYNLD